tara:strand:+ start:6880 stop:7269 length:390 start_codon:yes stop_codon:yes gene_type:complete
MWSVNMANMKRIEKRLAVVEDWMQQFEKGTGPKMVLDNMNWLIEQLRNIGGQMMQTNDALQNMQQQFQTNVDIVNQFIEEQELTLQWNAKLQQIREQQDAVQESSTEEVSLQEQAESGEEVREENEEGN